MATLSITIPDNIAARVRDGYCAATGYQAQMPNPAFDPMQPISAENPEFVANNVSKMAWVKQQVIAHIRDTILAAELSEFDTVQAVDRQSHIQSVKASVELA